MKCVNNNCIQRCDSFAPIHSATHRYQSISIYLLIVIDNRYQSITTQNFGIDWSSIININQLIDIDWYCLISIVINYRFYRLDTPGRNYRCWALVEIWSHGLAVGTNVKPTINQRFSTGQISVLIFGVSHIGLLGRKGIERCGHKGCRFNLKKIKN